ncbi:hypothetical protein McanMca71_006841 [Microsporum canis]|uniref:Uncharacterized protein n=1 Tax=Arthroderma otae (strain ATCC MYA-4605 / CBS 113480) TaxID=554155 RepID=C5FN34_ARTOC|nr:uncharacterized protein MCYG_04089 [Microsporum canis CBS 113480]EEQ31270.1 predicted protein [Microsporum canis CBS 113480]
MGNSVRAHEIETVLKLCAEKRQRNYEVITGLAILFEQDDTGAAEEYVHFKSLLKTFGVNDIEQCVILAGTRSPGHVVARNLHMYISAGIDRCSKGNSRRYLAIVHYAGHGFYDPADDNLYFTSGHKEPYHFSSDTLTNCIAKFYEGTWPPFDVVLSNITSLSATNQRGLAFLAEWQILTRGVSLRGSLKQGETVELLAGVDDETTAFSRTTVGRRRTFTSKLADQVALASARMLSIDFIELLQRTYDASVAKKPVHKFLAGNIPIRLPFASGKKASLPQSPTIQLSMITGEYTVVIACHIVDDPSSTAVKRLVKSIEDIHSLIGVTVDQVYRCRSSGLVLRVPHSILLSLETLPGIKVMFEYVESSESESPASPSSLPKHPFLPPASPSLRNQENMPPGGLSQLSPANKEEF